MFITDRLKELIKYKGSQVAPAELEGVIASHPKVKDVSIIGTYVDAIASEVPLGYVVPCHVSLLMKPQLRRLWTGWLRKL
jgi:acyl-CoA synthetase (AMP-forming)/AMP-acid ligase II